MLRVLGTVILVGDREGRSGQAIHALEVRLITDRVTAARRIVVTNPAHARTPLVRADISDHGVSHRSFRHYPMATEQQTRCSKCGGASHTHPNYCPAINLTCYSCGRKGHIPLTCRTMIGSQPNYQTGY